jgi:hypothetical protein
MKLLLSLMFLILASSPAASGQATSSDPAPQVSNDNTRSASGKSTRHDRRMRKHRANNRHHRPQTTNHHHS